MADRLGLSEHLGYQPLFCIPVSTDSLEDFWFRAWSSAPRKPEEILLIDAPDDLPVPMDVIAWTGMMADEAIGRHFPRNENWDYVLQKGDRIATDWLLPPGCDGCSVRRIGISELGSDWSWIERRSEARGIVVQRRVEFALRACEDIILSGQMESEGRIQREVTNPTLYGALTLSSMMPIVWEEMTGNRVLMPMFHLTPQRLASGPLSLKMAQSHLLEWDESLCHGRAKDIRFLRQMKREFERGIGKVARSAANDLAKQAGVMRGDPCPCGSGVPYKKCHGKASSIDRFIAV